MFRPAIQRIEVLVAMALISLLVFYAASSIRTQHTEPGYELKIAAAEKMAEAMTVLKDYRMEGAIFVDEVNDPNETGLIGRQFTLITTDEGDLDAKISVLDPNVAAMVVDYFLRAGVGMGDTIAVTLTGSMPGGNLAVYSAIHALKLTPIIISSVGASQWGANIDDFTWLDMEHLLFQREVFHFLSHHASMGGGSDIGRRLSPEGRQLILDAISRNNIALLDSRDLEDAVIGRMAVFQEIMDIESYDCFINVGGGAAVLGNAATARILPPGLTTRLDFTAINNGGVIARFGRAGVPIVHVLNINSMFQQFDYPYAATPLPEIGQGSFYASERYHPVSTGIALLLLVAMLVCVGLHSKRKIKHHLEKYEPDSYI